MQVYIVTRVGSLRESYFCFAVRRHEAGRGEVDYTELVRFIPHCGYTSAGEYWLAGTLLTLPPT